MLRKLADRVREAIAAVPTKKEIATKLPKTRCAIPWRICCSGREIRTQIVRHQRMYFVNEALEELASRGGS